MKKLELKHISPYLPYGLQVSINEEASTRKFIFPVDVIGYEVVSPKNIVLRVFDNGIKFPFHVNLEHIKPVLNPLSFMLEDIICEQFFEDESELLGEEFSAKQRAIDFIKGPSIEKICEPYEFWQLMFRLHIDVFGLIEAGLALNKNHVLNLPPERA